MEMRTITLKDVFAIVKKRKWSLIVPVLTIFITAGIVALALPSIYKSTSTILIEEQDIPDDYVRSTVSSYAEQRLQSIHQRIVSFSRLLDIINRFNLYPELKKRWTTEEIVGKMRKDIKLNPTSANKSGGRKGATIAFTLSYEGKNPTKVQRVADILASLFLEENLQVREKQATETSEFLEKEMEKVKATMGKLGGKVASFKVAHINELPNLLEVNMQAVNDIKRNIERLNEQLRSLKEREGYIQLQLASVPSSESEKKDKVGLEQLKVHLLLLKARYTESHPDLIRTKAEIAELEKRLKDSENNSEQSTDSYENPVHITLSTQLSSTQTEIKSIKRQITKLNKMADEYGFRIANTPKVEETYQAMLIERNNTQAKYNDLMKKYMEAKVAQGLEKEQKGERFTLLNPARFPEKPFKPNRLSIALIGLVLGIGAGVGWASLKEFTDHSVRDSDSLTLATSFPVLAGIPEIVTDDDILKQKKKRVFTITLVVLGIAAGLFAFHYFVMDLNVFWAKLMRKINF